MIGDNCRILDGATVNACILWEGATVQANTHLERCIVGKNCRVETNAAIFDGIIADPNRPMPMK